MLKKSLPSIFNRQRNTSSEEPKINPDGSRESFWPLKQEEADLIRHLLETGGIATQGFLPQLSGLKATKACTCGCPSIALEVAEHAPAAENRKHIIVDDVFGYSAGKLVGLILFADDGKLSELEVYDVAGQFSDPFGLPEIKTLTKDGSAPMTQPAAQK